MAAMMAANGAITGLHLNPVPASYKVGETPTKQQELAMQTLTRDNSTLAARLRQITGSNSLTDWAAYFKQIPEADRRRLAEDKGSGDAVKPAEPEKPGFFRTLLDAWTNNRDSQSDQDKEKEKQRRRTQAWVIGGSVAFVILLLIVVLVMRGGNKIV
jgi:hypothetical protein